MTTVSKVTNIGLLVVFLQITSLRAIAKYAPYPEIAALILIAGAAVFYWLMHKPVFKILLSSGIVTALLMLAITAANLTIYPYANARAEMGMGSNADEAIIGPARAWLHGERMYDDAKEINGAIASPGPGWVMANAVFSIGGIYPLLVPFYLILAGIVIWKQTRSLLVMNGVLLALCSSLIVWELDVTGHDAIAISAVIAALYLLSEQLLPDGKFRHITLLAIATGIFATSRIIFPFLAPLICLVMWKKAKWQAFYYAIISTTVTLALHLYYFMQNAHYGPLHLYGRAETHMGNAMIIAGGIATLLMGGLCLLAKKETAEKRLQWFILCFATPLFFISLGELHNIGYSFSTWEGANYLMPVMVTIVFYVFGRNYLTGADHDRSHSISAL